ncbi:DEAD/DEAH box helicase [Alkalinema pantanalense CENA528]|uniref:DEAD/DEAH box helicase n=1 Tax=Alkalinema pantanalense TaxID=1620705 RepID=UPI003D6FDF8F
MKFSVNLQDLLQQNEEAIVAMSTFIAQGMAEVDCSAVATIPPTQLELLFSNIPTTWTETNLTNAFHNAANALQQQFLQHLGLTPVIPTLSPKQHTQSNRLDIFNLRDEVVQDYRSYIESFLRIRDSRVKNFVSDQLDSGALWKAPLLQLNPAYKPGATVTELIQQGIFHPDCAKYFSKNGQPYRYHYHQEQAFRTAQSQQPYVVTTGTGSGKSMTYVAPIFDDILKNPDIKGVRAILVYPMNALINSQEEELNKFLSQVPDTPIRVAKYTGQESLTQKNDIQNNPPHILLTNYVMLELMLTRMHEKTLIESPDLKFLVFDELHTYRGRQGADVALLIRKLRQRSGRDILCIGTSATMSSQGNRSDRTRTVAAVASKLFGIEIKPENVIGETLQRAITRPDPTIAELQTSLTQGLPPATEQTLETFQAHPLAAWIEMNFGLENEDGHLIRRTPISLETGARILSQQTGINFDRCLDTLKQMFRWGSQAKGLAFRLHQFISQGGSVYATIEPHAKRELTLEGQYTTTENRLLYPLVFCRECGHDYYVVKYDTEQQRIEPLLPTALNTPTDDNIYEGYLTLNEPDFWEDGDIDRLPDTWFKETKRDGRAPKKEYAAFIPRRLQVLADGTIANSLLKGTACWFIPKPFLTCLQCGVVHDRKKNEFTKLARLSSEGRSTATTLLCLSTVSRLKQVLGKNSEATKILSFTDNRQDASLQAGHFNDFVQTSFLRVALNQALQANQALTHSELAMATFEAMQLDPIAYIKIVKEHPETILTESAKRRADEKFRELIEYRLYEDLRRGWRIIQPNLEQSGLLAIEYLDLQEICDTIDHWQHPILRQATPQQRFRATKALLDQLRRELAIDAALLQPTRLEQLKRDVQQSIAEPWSFDEFEMLHKATWAISKSQNTANAKAQDRGIKLTAKSKVGRFLKSSKAWDWLTDSISDREYDNLIRSLLNTLRNAGLLLEKDSAFQLRIEALIWRSQLTDTIPADPLTSRRLQGEEDAFLSINQFFQNFYNTPGTTVLDMAGREHTGQVPARERQIREAKFRQGDLEALFCSPTMELGIDISDLSVVHMRNIPPNPANYAQRSGRAGRSGQEALVITYASVGSGHDQYFFRNQNQMVAGVVMPPKLELGNPDLVKSHLYSIWLAATGVQLGDSMNQILDLEQETYPLRESLAAKLQLPTATISKCVSDAYTILSDIYAQQDLTRFSWYSDEWLTQVFEGAYNAFDRACDRWRRLYNDANKQLIKARDLSDQFRRGTINQETYDNAESLEKEAQRQLALLVGQTTSGKGNSEMEFYPYRYFASEGFLPGYNFPRLPVRAFIKSGDTGDFISRPRVVALREFAPNNVVYYEGSKFQIDRTRLPAGEVPYNRVSTCFHCGYFHTGDDWNRDTCENCGAKLTDANGNHAKLNRVLAMDTMLTRRRERITCDEEERLKYGYKFTTHFRYAENKQQSAQVMAESGSTLLDLNYGETANIWRINRGLRRNQEQGFKLDIQTGTWNPQSGNTNNTTLHQDVNLMIQETSNILIIEPKNLPVANTEAFLATLQHALTRAIQAIYKLEDNELSSERLGQGKTLLFWESAEGGAGVLTQILEDPKAFQTIAQTALEICHFTEPKNKCIHACYECLLSYNNQFDHPLIDRYLIKDWLIQLQSSQVKKNQEDKARKAQYEKLLQLVDPNSSLEKNVLETIYIKGLPLPDSCQEIISEANIKPDFIYKDAKIAIFCDGSVHNAPDKQQQDRIERDNLKYQTGYRVITLRYDEDWQTQLNSIQGLVNSGLFS